MNIPIILQFNFYNNQIPTGHEFWNNKTNHFRHNIFVKQYEDHRMWEWISEVSTDQAWRWKWRRRCEDWNKVEAVDQRCTWNLRHREQPRTEWKLREWIDMARTDSYCCFWSEQKMLETKMVRMEASFHYLHQSSHNTMPSLSSLLFYLLNRRF